MSMPVFQESKMEMEIKKKFQTLRSIITVLVWAAMDGYIFPDRCTGLNNFFQTLHCWEFENRKFMAERRAEDEMVQSMTSFCEEKTTPVWLVVKLKRAISNTEENTTNTPKDLFTQLINANFIIKWPRFRQKRRLVLAHMYAKS